MLRFLETYLATDDPVTVAGTPRRGEEPGTAVVDGEGGDADGTERQPYRRVYCPGAAGLAMVLLGTFGERIPGFVLSGATLSL